jgi:hypothetical protein
MSAKTDTNAKGTPPQEEVREGALGSLAIIVASILVMYCLQTGLPAPLHVTVSLTTEFQLIFSTQATGGYGNT